MKPERTRNLDLLRRLYDGLECGRVEWLDIYHVEDGAFSEALLTAWPRQP